MHMTTYLDGSHSFHDAGLTIGYHEDGTPRGASLALLPGLEAIPLDPSPKQNPKPYPVPIPATIRRPSTGSRCGWSSSFPHRSRTNPTLRPTGRQLRHAGDDTTIP